MWRSGSAVASQAVIFDRKGNRIGTVGAPVPANRILLSPDEAHLLVASAAGVWVMESNGPGRVSLGSGVLAKVWSPYGSGVIENRGPEIVQRSIIGDQNIRQLAGPLVAGERLFLHDISADGRRILYSYIVPPSLLLFSLDEEHRSQSIVSSALTTPHDRPTAPGRCTILIPNLEFTCSRSQAAACAGKSRIAGTGQYGAGMAKRSCTLIKTKSGLSVWMARAGSCGSPRLNRCFQYPGRLGQQRLATIGRKSRRLENLFPAVHGRARRVSSRSAPARSVSARSGPWLARGG